MRFYLTVRTSYSSSLSQLDMSRTPGEEAEGSYAIFHGSRGYVEAWNTRYISKIYDF